MMTLVIFLTTIELAWIILQDIITPPIIFLEINQFLEIFGFSANIDWHRVVRNPKDLPP